MMDSPIPSEESLRSLPYSELKKVAKSRGIRGSFKAKNLISKLLSVSVSFDDMNSFSTPMQQVINSSSKNKKAVFDKDHKTPLVTPRRGTYSLDDDSIVIKEPQINEDFKTPRRDTYSLDDSVVLGKLELTVEASPEKSAVLDECNVTMLRGSDRKLRPRKVSFLSPMRRSPKTPRTQYMSLKDRPKTPIASRTENTKAPVPSSRSAEKGSSANKIKSAGKGGSISKSKENIASKLRRQATPVTLKENTTTKLGQTPNFKQIHQKAFDKMESIDDYQQRKLKNSAKKLGLKAPALTKTVRADSKIPAFSGIRFIPSVTSCSEMKLNFAPGIPRTFDGKKEAHGILKSVDGKKESKVVKTTSTLGKPRTATPALKVVKGRAKFDLKASLSRKLNYKPYSGPLKPLAESNCCNTPTPACCHGIKEPEVVHQNRSKSRMAVQGVRRNKRFELQMKNRKV